MAIETIAIVHHVHTDFGYTDHPQRSKKEHIKYIDQAVDYVLESKNYPECARFAWTQEQLYPVRQWWEQASDLQKERFFEAIATGRLEITGTAFNVTAFLDKEEWNTMMHWIPDELWNKCGIRSAMQIDVNGMHTYGMECAFDRGVKNLWIGPNSYYGAPPMPTPAAFNWELTPGKNMFVWLNSSYNNGTFMFNKNWRQGPVPDYSDMRYRKPEAGDIWAYDDKSLEEAHKLCLENIAMIEGVSSAATAETDGFTKNRVFGGYKLSVLPVSVTSQWRVDNDPPFFPLAEFVKRWNEKGLKPKLMLCTASQAMDMVKEEMGENIPLYKGEWIDWWANGNASAPVEMGINREAKRRLRQAASPVFGELSEAQQKEYREIMENICLYDEHCFSSWQSVSNPYSFANISQVAEKNIYTYRALDGAKCLLADRVRPLAENDKNRIVVWNTERRSIIRSIELPLGCMRGDYNSVVCDETGEQFELDYIDGIANFMRPSSPEEFGEENVSHTFSDRCEKQAVRFGPINIPPMSCLHFSPSSETACEKAIEANDIIVKTDNKGWPVYVKFETDESPVIDGAIGELVSVTADGFAPRWTMKDIFENDDPDERKNLRKIHLNEVFASYMEVKEKSGKGIISYSQNIGHKSLSFGKRILTIDTISKTVKLELKINRISSFEPEVMFLKFTAPDSENLPYVSNAGRMFIPEKGQLQGSCMDFYAIDGWMHYDSNWIMQCRDNALVTFGATSVVARKTETEGPVNDIYVRLIDNIWDTNFGANACGQMNFNFFIKTGECIENAEEAAKTMEAEPIVVVKMGY